MPGYALLMLNPWLVQSTTLMLTDLSAACAVAWSFLLLWENQRRPMRTETIYWGVLLLGVAGMIRPGMLIFTPLYMLVYAFRFLTEDGLSFRYFLRPIPLASILFAAVLLPQVIFNFYHAPEVRFPIIADLMKEQRKMSDFYLKYGTFYKNGRTVACRFIIPAYHKYPDAESFVSEAPGKVRLTKLVHIPAVLDQGEMGSLDSYMIERPKWLHALAVLGNWLFWFGAASGIVLGLGSRGIRRRTLLLALPIFGYLLFMTQTVVESRFVYPALLLALPLCIQGTSLILQKAGLGLRTSSEERIRCFRRIAVLLIVLLAYLGLCLWFHTWIDRTAC